VIGGNISEAVVNCTLTGIQVYTWGNTLIVSANNNPSLLLTNWMFAQFANSLKYKKAFDSIRENDISQNHILNFQQYGLICKLFLLDIQPVLAGVDGDVAMNGTLSQEE